MNQKTLRESWSASSWGWRGSKAQNVKVLIGINLEREN